MSRVLPRVRDFLNTSEVGLSREPASFWREKGKHDCRRHSTTSFSENVVITEKSEKVLEVLSF